MAYESPINVWWSDTRIEQLRDEYGNLIIKAVKNVCPEVDRDELIKALEYDRGQYEKGFADGIAYKPPVKSRGDSIRAMTDEELAYFIAEPSVAPPPWCKEILCPHWYEEIVPCHECALDWLKKEVSDEENHMR